MMYKVTIFYYRNDFVFVGVLRPGGLWTDE
jgi:hypothetical protein